jgi:vesicle transport through interaction with t-SNAREs protein 1
MRLEKSNIPANLKSKFNARFRNFEHDLDTHKRKLETYTTDRSKLFGDRYTDNPEGGDAQLEQRQQLLSGTDRLNRSSGRLRESQRIALETEQIGAGTLSDLHRQREQITNTRERLLESESYTDRSIKTLRGMARRYVFPPAAIYPSCTLRLMWSIDGCPFKSSHPKQVD